MKNTLILMLIAIATIACEDLEYSNVPDVAVSTTFLLDDYEFINFDYGSSIAFTEEEAGGYAGIILYRVTEDLIHSYDRCCPLHVEDKEELLVDGALAMCPTDSIYWPISFGEPALELDNDSTPSILKSYKNSKSGNTLTVYN